eukprot:16059951-Heterocapsa_arctica.AAC.1
MSVFARRPRVGGRLPNAVMGLTPEAASRERMQMNSVQMCCNNVATVIQKCFNSVPTAFQK